MTAISVQRWDSEKNYPKPHGVTLNEMERKALLRLVKATLNGTTPRVAVEKLISLRYRLQNDL